MNDYETAIQAIKNMLKTGRKFYPNYFHNLDFDARQKAIADMTCPLCHKVAPLTGTYHHIFGEEAVCKNCGDIDSEAQKEYKEKFPLKYA